MFFRLYNLCRFIWKLVSMSIFEKAFCLFFLIFSGDYDHRTGFHFFHLQSPANFIAFYLYTTLYCLKDDLLIKTIFSLLTYKHFPRSHKCHNT